MAVGKTALRVVGFVIRPYGGWQNRPTGRSDLLSDRRAVSKTALHKRLEEGMKKLRWLIIGLVLLPLVAGGAYIWVSTLMGSLMAYRSPLHGVDLPPGAPVGDGLAERVVFVIVDGLRTDTAADPEVMPFLGDLRAQGASATAHSRPPTSSQASWTTLVTGASTELNDAALLNADYPEIRPLGMDHLFAAAHDAGLTTALAGHRWWERMVPERLRDLSFFNEGLDAEDDRETADAALPWLRDRAADFVLIHLDQVDETGHAHGAVGPEWAQAAANVDGLLRDLAAELDFSRDVLIVTSDHGHVDRGGHGGQDAIVTQQPLVMVGAGVRPGEYGDVQNVDLAPTMAVLLGTRVPAANQGRVLWEMLEAPADLQAAGDAAVAQARAHLAAAYLTAIGREDAPGITLDERMTNGRAARLRAERWPRAVLAGVVALAPLPFLWRRRGRAVGAVLLGGLTYLAIYHLLFALVEGNTYSLSTLRSAGQVLGQMALNNGMGLIVGVGVALWVGRRAASRIRLALGTAWFAIYLAALPVLVGFACDSPTITWHLPDDFLLFFLYFAGLVQIMFLAGIGLLVVGVVRAVIPRPDSHPAGEPPAASPAPPSDGRW